MEISMKIGKFKLGWVPVEKENVIVCGPHIYEEKIWTTDVKSFENKYGSTIRKIIRDNDRRRGR